MPKLIYNKKINKPNSLVQSHPRKNKNKKQKRKIKKKKLKNTYKKKINKNYKNIKIT